jgi:hypothetical protein
MSDIFISYAREDRAQAATLARALGASGWSVWWDPSIPAGKTFDEVIERELDAASCAIVLWSVRSVGSQWVRNEADEAARRRILVPALIERDVRIPLAFRRIQAADLTGWDGTTTHGEFQNLVRDIAQIIGQSIPPQSDSVYRQVDHRRPDEPETGTEALNTLTTKRVPRSDFMIPWTSRRLRSSWVIAVGLLIMTILAYSVYDKQRPNQLTPPSESKQDSPPASPQPKDRPSPESVDAQRTVDELRGRTVLIIFTSRRRDDAVLAQKSLQQFGMATNLSLTSDDANEGHAGKVYYYRDEEAEGAKIIAREVGMVEKVIPTRAPAGDPKQRGYALWIVH